jgi:hypothetical protein
LRLRKPILHARTMSSPTLSNQSSKLVFRRHACFWATNRP